MNPSSFSIWALLSTFQAVFSLIIINLIIKNFQFPDPISYFFQTQDPIFCFAVPKLRKKICDVRESNLWPWDSKSHALPTELSGPGWAGCKFASIYLSIYISFDLSSYLPINLHYSWYPKDYFQVNYQFVFYMANSNSIQSSGLPGPVDKAPDFGSEVCRFDSCHFNFKNVYKHRQSDLRSYSKQFLIQAFWVGRNALLKNLKFEICLQTSSKWYKIIF